MKLYFRQISAFFLFICLSFLSIQGQSEAGSSSIDGTLTDSNGAVVQGATVIVKNTENGLERTLTTNADGGFATSVLPVGKYLITVKNKGFKETKREVVLRVGETTSVNLILEVEGQQVTVDVSSTDVAIVDTEESAAGSAISERAISDLPIRGRNYTEFVQLSPAVVQEGDRSGLVISGQRSINSNVALDGADFNDSLQGNQRGGNEAVFFFPQTAIREFQVVRSGATAEVGRTGAGFVNAVTKSGTNQFRGEIFYFNRNDKLTSPDAFGNDGDNNQNQFGGSIGGPLKKDKAFFFFGIEQNLLKIPYFVDFIQPTGVTLPTELSSLEGEVVSTNNPTSLFGRLDFNLNSNNTLNLQYTYSRLKGNNFGALDEGITLTSEANAFQRKGDSNGFKTSLVTVFNPSVINEARLQYATDNRLESANIQGPELRVDDIGIDGGSVRLNGNNSRPRIFETRRYQVSNNLSWNTGKHNFKFGFDFNHNRFQAQRIPQLQGTYRFQASGTTTSLANFINRIPRRLDQTVLILPEFAQAEGAQKEFALFVQDKFKVTKNFTLNAGFRWEGLDNPTPPNPNPAVPETQEIPDDWKQFQPRLGASWDIFGDGNLVVKVSAGLLVARTPATLFIRPFVENGLITRTVRVDEISGACRTSLTATNCALRRNPDGTVGTNFRTAFPNILVSSQSNLGTANRQRLFGFDPDFKNPRSFQFSTSVEHQFAKNFVLSAGIMRSSTWNLQRRLNRNLRPPISELSAAYPTNFLGSGFPVFASFPTGRINPNYDWFSINESTAHSDYNALTLSLRRRFANRFQLEANYTYSENRDDDSNERNFDRESTLNPFDLKSEAAFSKQDVRHNFNANAVVDLGYGFTLSGIVITRSGFPFTALMGDDFQNDTNEDNDRAIFDGKVVGRNSFRQPNFFNLDLRLLKNFNFSENRKLSFSAEVFNVTKASNKGFGPDAVSEVCVSTTSVFASTNNKITCPAGLVPSRLANLPFTAPSTARFGGPRQLQLGVKFTF